MSVPPVTIECLLTPPDGSLATSYRYYLREQGTETWHHLGSSDALRVTFDGLPRTGLWQIAVSSVVGEVEADPETWTVVDWKPDADDFDAPGDVTAFRAGQSGNLVLLWWEPVEAIGLSHYELRLGPTWDDALLIAKVPPTLTSWTTGAWYTGSATYWITAVSEQGASSATPASAALDIESQSYEPVMGTTNESGGGFTGTKTGTEVSGGNLRIESAPVDADSATEDADDATYPAGLPHYGSGTYETAWVDVGSVVRERVEVSLAAAADSRTVDADEWGFEAGYSDYLLPSGHDIRGKQIIVWIDTAQDATPTPDGWRRWIPGAVYKYRQVRLRLTLTSISPRNLVVTSFIWRRRRLNRKDEQIATVSGTGGTAVTWTTTFTAAPTVSVSVMTALSRFATVSDITTSGCNVRVFNDAGTEQASGEVHVLAMGV